MIKEEIQQLFELGKNAFKEKRYEEAIFNLEKIIDIYNKDFVLYSDERYIIYNIENEEDINKINNIIANTYYNIGVSKQKLKIYEESIKYFDKTININNNYFKAYYSRGVSKYNIKCYRNAIRDFNKTLELNNCFKEAYYYRGLSYFKLNKYKKSLNDFNNALENIDKNIKDIKNDIY